MIAGRGELIAADESTIVSKPLFDAIVVEDGQSDGCFPDSPCTNESEWGEAFRKVNNLLDQLVASETGPWWRGRGFTRYARCRYKTLDSSIVEIADLV